jgi:hypothetical protein
MGKRADRLGLYKAPLIGIAARNLGMGAQHDQTVQAPHVHLGQRCLTASKLAHIPDGFIMIYGLQMIPQRFAGDCDALFDDSEVSAAVIVFPSMAFDV